jgi:hypothetical protein
LFDDPHKTESRIPKGNTSYPKGKHTGRPKRAQKSSKRIPKGNIDSAPSMYPKGKHNCLPPPTALKAQSIPTCSASPVRSVRQRISP